MKGESVWPDGMTTCDWIEIAGLMTEWAEENTCEVEITLTPCGTKQHPDLTVTATAYTNRGADAVRVPSACVRARARRERFKSMKGLCIFLIYQLDFAFELKNEDFPADGEAAPGALGENQTGDNSVT